jgi:hypothetical protein
MAVYVRGFAFQNCVSLTTVSMPVATTIGEPAGGSTFIGCTSLVTISLPAAVFISGSTFQSCSSLAAVSLPSIVSLGSGVFGSCASLTEVTLGAVPPATIGANTFYGVATTAKTITIKTPYPDLYTTAGTPWSDKMGDSSTWGTFWDTTATRSNLTVALGSL